MVKDFEVGVDVILYYMQPSPFCSVPYLRT
jgi:hypothetical protein